LFLAIRKEIPVALYFRFAVVKDQQKLLCVKLGVLKFLLFDLINQIKLRTDKTKETLHSVSFLQAYSLLLIFICRVLVLSMPPL